MLDKAIENENLDLQIAIGKIKKLKQQLSQSLKRRKNIATQMNENLQIEENIEDNSSNKADAKIRELLEKNHTFQDEIPKLRDNKKFNQSGCVKSWNKRTQPMKKEDCYLRKYKRRIMKFMDCQFNKQIWLINSMMQIKSLST